MWHSPTNPSCITRGPQGWDQQLHEMSECSHETLQHAEGPMNKTLGALNVCLGSGPLLAAIITAVTSLEELLLSWPWRQLSITVEGGGAWIVHSVQSQLLECREEKWESVERKENDRFGKGKQCWGLSLTVARDSEVVCTKAVLDVRQRQGGMSQEVVLRAPVGRQVRHTLILSTSIPLKNQVQ